MPSPSQEMGDPSFYSHIPNLHGVMLGEKLLFISLCGMYKKARLDGSRNPYLRVARDSEEGEDEFSSHLFKVFNGWFAYYWNNPGTRQIWPPKNEA